MVGVADRHRERVARVVGERNLRQRQQRRDHPRHLILRGAAVSTDRPLDLLGRVGKALHAVLAGAQHRHPARLADGERGPHVLPEVERLELDAAAAAAALEVGEPVTVTLSGGLVETTPPSNATRRPPRRATTP